MQIMDVLLVHGYSETSLGAYFNLPTRLLAAAGGIGRIVLAAFDSLDDTVTIDDLADAMETRVRALENSGQFAAAGSGVLCHSTGALVVRRWILNRIGTGRAIPSHLITVAGANHGSTLAQMGKSVLGYVQKLIFKHLLTVGANVLTDLDYGSDFLLRLNREWMNRWNDGSLDGLYAFSMGGDFVGTDPALQVFWQTHEPGSDNTVRISGANLNYTLIDAAATPAGPQITATTPLRPIPHLVLSGYSHFGDQSGILGWVDPTADRVVAAVAAALKVADPASYSNLAAAWGNDLDGWLSAQRNARTAASPSMVNSTLIFTLRDEAARSIEDCVIVLLDQQELGVQSNVVDPQAVARLASATNAVSQAILPHSPIQNDAQRGSYAFYVDYDEYIKTSPHWFHVEAALPTDVVGFVPLTFTQPASLPHAIVPNQVTYVSLVMQRDADDAYAMYGFGPQLNLPGTTWMPFPAPGRLSP
jgi:hypothetical protein